jgi:uncharacterized protein YjbI with pentapeptide repeats
VGLGLEGATLRDVDLRHAHIAGSILAEADRHGANLINTDLTNADLTGAIHNETTSWPAGYQLLSPG